MSNLIPCGIARTNYGMATTAFATKDGDVLSVYYADELGVHSYELTLRDETSELVDVYSGKVSPQYAMGALKFDNNESLTVLLCLSNGYVTIVDECEVTVMNTASAINGEEAKEVDSYTSYSDEVGLDDEMYEEVLSLSDAY